MTILDIISEIKKERYDKKYLDKIIIANDDISIVDYWSNLTEFDAERLFIEKMKKKYGYPVGYWDVKNEELL